MQLGLWPPWIHYLLLSAAAQTQVMYYFIGGEALDTSGCSNCAWLPLGVSALSRRLLEQLNVSATRFHAQKMNDLKPMCGALFPELGSRHDWIGYADPDVLFGNLSEEVKQLQNSDDLLVPMERFPQPIANGNLLLMRWPKMAHAFRQNPAWEQVLRNPHLDVFDEWRDGDMATCKGGKGRAWARTPKKTVCPSMYATFQEMLLAGNLRPHPTQRMLVQDTVIIPGQVYPTVDSHRAKVSLTWRRGQLEITRDGPCLCPNDVVPQFGITVCAQCLTHPGELLKSIHTSRQVQILGFHFQAWKKRWRRTEFKLLERHNGSRPEGVRHPAPPCPPGSDFDLRPDGFVCIPIPGPSPLNTQGKWLNPSRNYVNAGL